MNTFFIYVYLCNTEGVSVSARVKLISFVQCTILVLVYPVLALFDEKFTAKRGLNDEGLKYYAEL